MVINVVSCAKQFFWNIFGLLDAFVESNRFKNMNEEKVLIFCWCIKCLYIGMLWIDNVFSGVDLSLLKGFGLEVNDNGKYKECFVVERKSFTYKNTLLLFTHENVNNFTDSFESTKIEMYVLKPFPAHVPNIIVAPSESRLIDIASRQTNVLLVAIKMAAMYKFCVYQLSRALADNGGMSFFIAHNGAKSLRLS